MHKKNIEKLIKFLNDKVISKLYPDDVVLLIRPFKSITLSIKQMEMVRSDVDSMIKLISISEKRGFIDGFKEGIEYVFDIIKKIENKGKATIKTAKNKDSLYKLGFYNGIEYVVSTIKCASLDLSIFSVSLKFKKSLNKLHIFGLSKENVVQMIKCQLGNHMPESQEIDIKKV